jgi:FkbM family methyltransferase
VSFANRFPTASILALEPEAENFKLLQHNTSFYPKIEILQAAVWDKDTFIQVVDAGFGNRGFIVKECDQKTEHSMEAFSIASLIKRFPSGKIDILKIDIEGSEKEVFSEGFENWLPQCRCVIVELHDRMKEGCSQAVFKAFSKFNFSCEISGGNLVFCNQNEI